LLAEISVCEWVRRLYRKRLGKMHVLLNPRQAIVVGFWWLKFNHAMDDSRCILNQIKVME
jgi:hypothetical protein